jgi:hypothetical protein
MDFVFEGVWPNDSVENDGISNDETLDRKMMDYYIGQIE